MKQHTLRKKLFNHEYIVTVGVGVIFDTFTYNKAGYMNSFELTIHNEETYKGYTVEEFLGVLDKLKEKYELIKKSEFVKDTLIIYTNDLQKVLGFLMNYDNNISVFGQYYFTFKDVFEFRDINIWFKNLNNSKVIAAHAQALNDDLFVKDKYFYITPTQSVTKRIKHNCDSSIAKDIFPKTRMEYDKLLKSYFGGICVANYTNLLFDDFRMVEYDRKSAYIFDLLIEKHLCEPLREENVDNLQYYLDNEDKYFALVTIKIDTIKGLKRASYYIKNIKGKHLEEDCNDILILTNTDLNLLNSLCTILTYKCLDLKVGKKDYLPRYVASVIEDEYAKKVELERLKSIGLATSEQVKLQKIKVNSIYGATVKKITDFIMEKDIAYLTPHWGIETSAFARKNLLSVALQLDNWLYSDTDSIFCEDNFKNGVIINEFNKNCKAKVKAYCDRFNLCYDIYKELGTFKIECIIKKMKILGKKTYMYTTVDNDFYLKASGIITNYDESAYNLDKLSAGKKVIGKLNRNKTSCVIDGVTYISNGSYYDKNIDTDSMEFIAEVYKLHELLKRR